MKKIFLIGDSIRFGLGDGEAKNLGYGIHVERKLAGLAKVFQPDDNCRFLQYTLRYLHSWADSLGIGEDIDIVHWNNGLWDLLRLFGDDVFTPLEVYEMLLVRVHKRIKYLFPNARIIFALTTPVIEELSSENFTRRNEDIIRYNNSAVSILTPLGVKINDLYSVAEKIQPKHHYDWVHFDEIGADILADKVIDALGIEK